MTGSDIREARLKACLTQLQVASSLGLTQPYLSLVEGGHRPVSASLATRALKVFDLPPTALPMEPDNALLLNNEELKSELGALGYPEFSYLRGKQPRNPTQLLAYVLDQSDLDARVVEALPWMTYTYVEMDWEWLVEQVKQRDRQNRLGFVVTIAGAFAEKIGDRSRADKLNHYRKLLDRSRLVREDTLCHDSMTKVERSWLRKHRLPQARHWNLLTDLDLKHLVSLALKSEVRRRKGSRTRS
jgi:transcriptional regulator with XRE-family HTH domain